VKLAELVHELPMLAVQETAGPDLQNQLIEDTLLVLLGDEDARVRKAATDAFVKYDFVFLFFSFFNQKIFPFHFYSQWSSTPTCNSI